MKSELILTGMNRAVGPAAVVVATAILARHFDSAEFGNFLIYLTVSQWGLQFFYQWIKNGMLKIVHYTDYFFLSYGSIFFSTLALYYFIGFFQSQTHTHIFVFLYTFSCGLFYFFSTAARLSGSIKTPQILEILACILRWIAGVSVGVYYNSVPEIFLTMASVNFCCLIAYFFVQSRSVSRTSKFGALSFARTSFWLFVIDASGSSAMYVDRIVTKNTDLIIYSTIGSQIVSVLLGTVTAMLTPRISRALQSRNQSNFITFSRYLSILLLCGLASAAIAVAAAPIATYVLSPETNVSYESVFLYSTSQFSHFIFLFLSIALLMLGNNYVAALIYFISCLSYVAFCYSAPTLEIPWYPAARTAVTLFACICLGSYVLNQIRINK